MGCRLPPTDADPYLRCQRLKPWFAGCFRPERQRRAIKELNS
jgi:hypothetical protein